MVIYEVGYFGEKIKFFYVLLIGIGLIWMLVIGIMISGLFSKKKLKKKISLEVNLIDL